MGRISYEHPDWVQSVYWEFDPVEGWDSFHQGLDQLVDHTENCAEPFFLIFHPSGDVPKGNPIPHMRRIIQLSKQNDMVIQTIIIMKSNWLIAQTFAKLLNKLMALEPEVKLVFSVEEAHSVHEKQLTARQSK